MKSVLQTDNESGYIFRESNAVKMFYPPFWKGVYSKRKKIAPVPRKQILSLKSAFKRDLVCIKSEYKVTKVVSLFTADILFSVQIPTKQHTNICEPE